MREALAPAVRRAAVTGLIPAIDQTKNAGLVTLPGTFVGLVLGGASPAEAARVQLVVLLSLLAVQAVAALAVARLVVAGLTARASVSSRLRRVPRRVEERELHRRPALLGGPAQLWTSSR